MIDALDVMVGDITKKFPELEGEIEYHRPLGGFFIWVQFPTWMNADNALEVAKTKYQFSYLKGSRASFIPSTGNHAIRLCFVLYDPPVIQDGINRLRDLIIEQYSSI